MSALNGVQQLAVLILAGGGAAGVYTLVKAVILFRNSTDTREASAIRNLERWRIDADRRAEYFRQGWDFQRRLTEFWWRRAGQLEYAATIAGAQIPPCPPEPQMPPELEQLKRETEGETST